VAESLMFESNAAIEEAVGTGQISTMQAALIRQLKHTEDIDEFVHRARETTWRQFQREYRLLVLLRKCNLGRFALRPLSQGKIEEVLIAALGGDREAIEEALRIRGIPPVPPGSSTDPAENPVLMDRLEALVQLLALSQWDEVPRTGEADRQTSAYQQAETWTRFWLRRETYHDLKEILWGYRKSQPQRMPEWVAMTILFAQVTEIWEQEDPERRPVRGKILRRDHYRCVIPGCTRRDQLETHHIKTRARGGGNDPSNLSVLCHGHHHHGVHKGHVSISGTAPHALRYELGRQAGESMQPGRGPAQPGRPREPGLPGKPPTHPPLFIYMGNRLLKGPFDPEPRRDG
jgi:hypothetical protein